MYHRMHEKTVPNNMPKARTGALLEAKFNSNNLFQSSLTGPRRRSVQVYRKSRFKFSRDTLFIAPQSCATVIGCLGW
jgi:hypothetical protein